MSETIIKVSNLDVEFKTDNQTIKALDKINFEVQKNEFIYSGANSSSSPSSSSFSWIWQLSLEFFLTSKA